MSGNREAEKMKSKDIILNILAAIYLPLSIIILFGFIVTNLGTVYDIFTLLLVGPMVVVLVTINPVNRLLKVLASVCGIVLLALLVLKILYFVHTQGVVYTTFYY